MILWKGQDFGRLSRRKISPAAWGHSMYLSAQWILFSKIGIIKEEMETTVVDPFPVWIHQLLWPWELKHEKLLKLQDCRILGIFFNSTVASRKMGFSERDQPFSSTQVLFYAAWLHHCFSLPVLSAEINNQGQGYCCNLPLCLIFATPFCLWLLHYCNSSAYF